MADTSIYEVTRQTHEEIERYTQAAVELLADQTQKHIDPEAESLRRQHQVSTILDRVVARYGAAHSLYVDASGDAQKESVKIAQGVPENENDSGAKDDVEAEFYARLDRIREYHKKYPGAMHDAVTIDVSSMGLESVNDQTDAVTGTGYFDRLFSGEEMGGRFLDLYICHDDFLNLKSVRRISYLQYIDSFDKLSGESSRIPAEAKRTNAYKQYLQSLQTYLLQFLRRTRPLADIDAIELHELSTFEEDWDAGKVQGWEDQGESVFGQGSKAAASGPTSSSAAASDGLWCDACQRSFAKQTVFDAHLQGSKHLKAAARLKIGEAGQQNGHSSNAADQQSQEAQAAERMKRQARAKAIARDEMMIVRLGAELHDVRSETRANVERKAALTDRERQAEAEAAAAASEQGTDARMAGDGAGTGAADGNDEDGEKIYNPLKLPLGWDGKPIPFWLYKLHGLGVEFKCEICSDFVYQGRKNFERHFGESRHAFGMRALGLPNSKHFYEITRIQDALTLADKLKRQGKIVADEQGDAEEVEDEHGNTYTKKTYDLLKRQGLI